MAQRERYIRWCQSDTVHVLVGSEEDGDSELRLFRMPMDLLGRQSRVLQVMLDGRFTESATRLIKLPETSIATFQDFFVWAFSIAPDVDPAASLEAVVDLAIFATIYEVFALRNQAVDVIRAKLGSGVWQLEPDIVKRVYKNAGANSTLRRVIVAALGTIGKPIMTFGSVYKFTTASPAAAPGIIESWRDAFEDEADPGADFFATTIMAWEGHDLTTGVGACRFHDHGGRLVADDTRDRGPECPFQATECFLDVVQVAQQEAEIRVGKYKKKKKKAAIEWGDSS